MRQLVSLYSIVIPVHSRGSLTRQCLDILLSSPHVVDIEVIVVDDASQDQTPSLLTSYGNRIRVLTHGERAGFAATCNDGAAIARGDYVVFLNNDTIPLKGWVDALVDYIRCHPMVAIVGSKLLFPNRTIQHAGVAICQDGNPRHLYVGFPATHPAVNKSRRLQAVTAACMLVRRNVFEQLGGFDTAFRNGYEDIDFCLRAGRKGREIHYCHQSVLIHLERASREERVHENQHNLRLFRSRWGGRVEPDEFRYYQEDGLLRFRRSSRFPGVVSVSPLLARVSGEHDRTRVLLPDRLIKRRSRQIADLLRELLRLELYLEEIQLLHNGLQRNPCPDKPPEPTDRCGSETPIAPERTRGWQDLTRAHAQLLRMDERLMGLAYRTQVALAAAQKGIGEENRNRNPLPLFEPSNYLAYQEMCCRLREIVRTVLPPEAIVLVVSHGDGQLLELDGSHGWHFPRGPDGLHPGFHPASSREAISHLESLRASGADFLLFPQTARWWFDSYPEFAEHLNRRYQTIVRASGMCLIFDLRKPETKPATLSRTEHLGIGPS